MNRPKIDMQSSSNETSSGGKETRLCIIIDSKMPIIMRVPIPPESMTLGQFKAIASLQTKPYKFYFKSYDCEFGVVKEEVADDDSYLPVDGDRIVAWVITCGAAQSSLFNTRNSCDKLARSDDTSPTHLINKHTPNSVYGYTNSRDDSIIFRVQLELEEHNFLGLTLVGPSDETSSVDKGIYVGEIAQNSAVDQNGLVEVGDRIIEINGLDVRNMRNDDAVVAFRKVVDRRGAINLVLQRDINNEPLSKGRFTLPREYIPKLKYTPPNTTETSFQSCQELPIPDQFNLRRSEKLPPLPHDVRLQRGTHSLPRSITPRSLYTTNACEGQYTDRCLNSRIDSRSFHEPSTPTSNRQFDIGLNCAKDSIYTIYAALKGNANDLEIKDREWLKVVVKNAFLGSMLVKWLSRNVFGFNHRRDVKRYANQMLNLGLIRSPMASGTFSEKCFYTLS